MPLMRIGFLALSGLLIVAWTVSAGEKAPTDTIVPLFDQSTPLESKLVEDTADALISHVGDRVRGRHAREAKFRAYDGYNTFYWEHRTVGFEIIDRVAKGGNDITFNITSLWPLDTPDFRAFYVGKNTVAEYAYNVDSRKIDDTHYTATIKTNARERRPLKIGDVVEFEFSPFLVKPPHGRENYYGSAIVYVVGRGVVPWRGTGEGLDPEPLPESAWLGGNTTLPYPYSNEPLERFKQLSPNVSPANAQAFMLGRRLHHTNFQNGTHSERGNPAYEEQAGKLGPHFIAASCVACHKNNGRALLPETDKAMLQSVIKVATNETGTPHDRLGSALQPQAVAGEPEALASIHDYKVEAGQFADGERYELRQPLYKFEKVTPDYYSVRLSPQLVGLGLLEAIPEKKILELADPHDLDKDGISGRAHVVRDPESNLQRLGRYGYKASQPRLKHQIAGAFNSDMGMTTSIFPKLDQPTQETAQATAVEVSDADLDLLYRYVALLGVPARRDIEEPEALQGERLFTTMGCAKCHVTEFKTSSYHPLAELRDQKIHPYTDLLLHDMGPALADKLGEADVTGGEWRTAPLWGIGHTADVAQGEAYLHDSRARSLAEAILWHGGEGEAAKEAFRQAKPAERAALIKFLKSL